MILQSNPTTSVSHAGPTLPLCIGRHTRRAGLAVFQPAATLLNCCSRLLGGRVWFLGESKPENPQDELLIEQDIHHFSYYAVEGGRGGTPCICISSERIFKQTCRLVAVCSFFAQWLCNQCTRFVTATMSGMCRVAMVRTRVGWDLNLAQPNKHRPIQP